MASREAWAKRCVSLWALNLPLIYPAFAMGVKVVPGREADAGAGRSWRPVACRCVRRSFVLKRPLGRAFRSKHSHCSPWSRTQFNCGLLTRARTGGH